MSYDILFVATGSRIVPSETEGLMERGWRKNIFDFYTFDGAIALREFLRHWKGGKLAMNMFKLKRDDLIDRVEGILTVGEFYEISAGASIIFT